MLIKRILILLTLWAPAAIANFDTYEVVFEWDKHQVLKEDNNVLLFVPIDVPKTSQLTLYKNFALQLASLYPDKNVIQIDEFQKNISEFYPLGFSIQVALELPNPVKAPKESLKNCFNFFLSNLSDVWRSNLITTIKSDIYQNKARLEQLASREDPFAQRFINYRDQLRNTDFNQCYNKSFKFDVFFDRFFDQISLTDTGIQNVDFDLYGTLYLLLEPLEQSFYAKYTLPKDYAQLYLNKRNFIVSRWEQELAINAVPLDWDIPIDSAISKTKSLVSKLSFADSESFDSVVGFILVESLLSDMKQSYPVIQQSLNDGNLNEDIIGVLLSIDRIVTVCKPYFMTEQICPSDEVYRHLNWVIFKTGKNQYKVLLPQKMH